MTRSESTAVSELLAAVRAGEAGAADRLFPLLYDELRRAAGRLLSAEHGGHTFLPTDLVHEAWLRLGIAGTDGPAAIPAADRGHFVALTIRAMRQVLIDHARRRVAAKRGGGAVRVSLEERDGAALTSPEDLLALFDALDRLGAVEPRLRQVVEHRYLAGFTDAEIAELLGVTARTVQRDWVKARAWLYHQLYTSDAPA